MICILCGEELREADRSDSTGLPSHWQCALRSVAGGIGHWIAHDWWCPGGASGRNDPDAGLTYRQSSLLVAVYIGIVGPLNIDLTADIVLPRQPHLLRCPSCGLERPMPEGWQHILNSSTLRCTACDVVMVEIEEATNERNTS